MIIEASRQCALELDVLPFRIQQVRRITSAKLRYWRADPLIDPALLGVTELLANVHRHALPDKHCTVELCLTTGRLTVSVSDNDPRMPRVGTSEPLSTDGRGLSIVAALSDSWGTQGIPDGGKVVWFTLRADCPAPAEVVPAATPAPTPLPKAVATMLPTAVLTPT